jgi:hypothetical protein
MSAAIPGGAKPYYDGRFLNFQEKYRIFLSFSQRPGKINSEFAKTITTTLLAVSRSRRIARAAEPQAAIERQTLWTPFGGLSSASASW